MDLVFIELVLWGGLIFFFWALKDGLGKVESDIDTLAKPDRNRQAGAGKHYVQPERLFEPIGSYLGEQIHRYAIINGRQYQFDRISPTGSGTAVEANEYWIAPGLVYRECRGSHP